MKAGGRAPPGLGKGLAKLIQNSQNGSHKKENKDAQEGQKRNLVTAIQQMGERAEYIKIAGVGPNALDFHIAYYIGRLASQEPEAFFHIISKDTGFDPLIQHLKDNKILCGRWQALEDIPAVKASQVKSPEERAILFHSRLLQPKATKPRTEKTLRSAIAAHFQKQLTKGGSDCNYWGASEAWTPFYSRREGGVCECRLGLNSRVAISVKNIRSCVDTP